MIRTTSNNYPADRGRSYAEIEAAAARARTMMGYDLSSCLPSGVWLLELLTNHPAVIVNGREIPVLWEAKPTPGHVEADTRYDPEYEQLMIRVDFNAYEQLERGDAGPRPRFAICHEVGHVHLHAAELVRMAAMPEEKVALLRQAARKVKVFQNTEWQAEAFGGAWLMPAAGLDELQREAGVLLARDIMDRWDVSLAAAEARLRVWRQHEIGLKEVMKTIKLSQNRRATVPAVAQ